MIFPVFLKRGEVVLDRIQVGRIGRQKQQRGAGVLDELCRFRRFVKGRVVHDDQVLDLLFRFLNLYVFESLFMAMALNYKGLGITGREALCVGESEGSNLLDMSNKLLLS